MSSLSLARGEKPKVFVAPKRPSSLVMQRDAAEKAAKEAAEKEAAEKKAAKKESK